MISKAVKTMLSQREYKFVIPAEIVANVQEDNNLEHALLVLTKVKYAKIPVLDNKQHFKGLISLSMITETMLGLTGIDPSNLAKIKVKDVIQTDVKTIQPPYNMEEILHLLVDQTFLVVTDEEDVFKGILTRREIMKAVNYLAHDLEKEYNVTKK